MLFTIKAALARDQRNAINGSGKFLAGETCVPAQLRSSKSFSEVRNWTDQAGFVALEAAAGSRAGSGALSWTGLLNRRTLAWMAIRDLWRKLTQRRAKDKEIDVWPEHDKLPGLDHFVQPPKPQGLEKPKY